MGSISLISVLVIRVINPHYTYSKPLYSPHLVVGYKSIAGIVRVVVVQREGVYLYPHNTHYSSTLDSMYTCSDAFYTM